jgi:hypothetical protein
MAATRRMQPGLLSRRKFLDVPHISRRRERGQAAVESAIVLPLFVFLILGILQLGLMHQARLLTKYAAYKAVRVGALNNARKAKMEDAALATLLPLMSHTMGGIESITPIKNANDFQSKWQEYKQQDNNLMPESQSMKFVEVTICGPTTAQVANANFQDEIDFDDPASAPMVETNASTDWERSQVTKLRVQVTLNYRMPIPFANWVIWYISRGQAIMSQLRMGKSGLNQLPNDEYTNLANQQLYVSPIRANYTMRMQSNLYVGELPDANLCVIPWPKLEGQ